MAGPELTATGVELVSSSGGGAGTVTSVSVVSANGFAGTVATATTTPAITLSTTVTGILSGNGTAISAASTTGSGAVVLANTPTLITPILGVARGTSLALGGATIGTDALGVTGTATISGTLTDSASIFATNFLGLVGSTQMSGPANGTLRIDNSGASDGNISLQLYTSTYLTRPTGTSAIFQFGQADAASPVAQTIQFQNSTGSNAAGVNATLIAPLATGTAAPGDFIFQTGTVVGSGSGASTKTTALTIKGGTQQAVFSGNGVASVSPVLLNGTIFTGGTATTTFPQMLFQPTGTSAVTAWSTSGTIIGANVVSGFAGNFLDFHMAGAASLLSVSATGALTTNGNIIGNTDIVAAQNTGRFLLRNGGTIISSPASASIQFGAADAAVAVAQTTRVQSVVAGTAAANGANWTLIGSLPTGTGTSGDIILQTGVKTGSGTTQGTATTALTIKGETQTVLIASGKQLQLGNAATTGLAAGVLAATTNATITLTDASGQVYRIPCII